jgi:hypothetical protein
MFFEIERKKNHCNYEMKGEERKYLKCEGRDVNVSVMEEKFLK